MVRSLTMLLALHFALSGAVQDDPKKAAEEKKKQEEKMAEEAAKKAIEAYKKDRAKAKNPGDIADAIDKNLGDAEAHKLIRDLLQSILSDPNVDVRIAAVDALGDKKWKYDREAAKILIGAANSQRDQDTKKKCLVKFGNIAPYSMAVELKPWLRNDDIKLASEAIDACREIKSLRMLAEMVNLLGELDAIKKDQKPKDPGGSYGPPPPGVPPGTPSNSDEKVKRKDDLTPRVISCINELWKKYDAAIKTNTYVEANKQLNKHKPFFQKILDQEAVEEKKGPEPEDKK